MFNLRLSWQQPEVKPYFFMLLIANNLCHSLEIYQRKVSIGVIMLNIFGTRKIVQYFITLIGNFRGHDLVTRYYHASLYKFDKNDNKLSELGPSHIQFCYWYYGWRFKLNWLFNEIQTSTWPFTSVSWHYNTSLCHSPWHVPLVLL